MNSIFDLEAEIDDLLRLEKRAKADFEKNAGASFLHKYFDSQISPTMTDLNHKLIAFSKHFKNKEALDAIQNIHNTLFAAELHIPNFIDQEEQGSNQRQARRRRLV